MQRTIEILKLNYPRSGASLAGGVTDFTPPIGVGDAYEIFGVVKCDKNLTIDIFQGFDGSFLVSDRITVTADGGTFTDDGAGVKIGPIQVTSPSVKIHVNNTDGSPTSKFLFGLWQHG